MTDQSEGVHENRIEPGISVVIPLYNKASYVRRTVLGVLGQAYDRFEVIVVDDGSTDDSACQIADLDDARLRILRQPNAGPGAARNLGIAHARHEWVAFVDADDAWYPDHLAELARAIASFPAAGMASTAYIKRPESPDLPARPAGQGTISRTSLFEACRHRNVVCASTMAVRRAVFEQVGGFKAFWPGEDTDMWVRAGLRVPLAFSSRVTAIYTMETGGISQTLTPRRRSTAAAVEAGETPVLAFLADRLEEPDHHALHGAIRNYIDARLFSIARNALFDGDRMKARRTLGDMSRRSGTRYLLHVVLAHLPAVVFDPVRAAWRRRRRTTRG
ncbi:glycosyltransferase family 2 protein [Sphingomonas sp. R86520]|uniref:glycosyltransferase family 2 protein n=1 Tax=Sphingomonas sp. R86520 TaxID=3093859 RepID=UPI0036D2C65B